MHHRRAYFLLLINFLGFVTIAPSVGFASSTSAFLPSVTDGEINALAEQPDGKILVGGDLEHFGNVPRKNLLRLDAGGMLDTSFTPDPNDEVHCVAVQDDGKIIVGGRFTNIAGETRIALARLEADGTLDPTLLANGNDTVTCLAIQRDGKIVVGGNFSELGGEERNGIARLLPNGQLDPSFNPDVDDDILTMMLDQDDNILIGGRFGFVGNVSRMDFARLSPDGIPLAGFNHPFSDTADCVFTLPDGKMIAYSNHLGVGQLYRLDNSGSRDFSFSAPENFSVNAISVQTDGRLYVGGKYWVGEGDFTSLDSGIGRFQVNGTQDSFAGPISFDVYAVLSRSDGSTLAAYEKAFGGDEDDTFLSEVARSATSQTLETVGGDKVRWLRGGALPEAESVYFQTSADGVTWNMIGYGTPITGGWELAGISAPSSGKLRARAVTRSGTGNGSSGLIETVVEIGGTTGTKTYEEWALENLPVCRRGPDDRNGSLDIRNLIAYALGIVPAEAIATDLPSIAISDTDPDVVVFSYSRSKTAEGLVLEIREAVDLDSWSPASPATDQKVSEDAAREYWQATFPTTSLRRFIDLKATVAN